MKMRNRIFAILLSLALLVSVMPMVFAAKKTATVTWVTPSGTTTETVAVGDVVVCGEAPCYGDYTFCGWSDKAVALGYGADVYGWSSVGTNLHVHEDMTFYALYYFPESERDVPLFYWPRYSKDAWDIPVVDYNGDHAIIGHDFDLEEEFSDSLDRRRPMAFGTDGEKVDVVDRYGAVCSENAMSFSCDSVDFTFKFELQGDGTYTIRSHKTGEYLSVSGFDIAFNAIPDESSYWDIKNDGYGYQSIFSALNDDLCLLYDYYEGCFDLFDTTEIYADGYFPQDLFYVELHKRTTVNYMYTTNVSDGNPDEPIEPGHSCPSAKFTDLDLTSWYHEGVDFVLKNGYMNGVGSTTFRPDGTLNRAMVATVLYRVVGQPAVEGTCGFTDVAAGQWYTDAVIWAQENGIVTGYTDNTFRPMKEITRQEMAVMLARYAKLLGVEIGAGADLSTYPDAETVASWAQEAMAWCVGEGLINGVKSGGVSNLKPGNNATRAQFATIMMRYLTKE